MAWPSRTGATSPIRTAAPRWWTARSSFGRLDIVIANAGIDKAGVFAKQSMADFRAIFDTGFLGNLHLVHAAWPVLIGQKYGPRGADHFECRPIWQLRAGRVGRQIGGNGMVRALAIEGRRHGVGINAMAAGFQIRPAPYLANEIATTFDPSRVAPLVGWLAGPGCDVSGEVLVCGGGLVRRAGVGETDARPLSESDIGATVHDLQPLAWQGHASASDWFTQFLADAATVAKETP